MSHETITCYICKKDTSEYIQLLDGYICKECEMNISTLDHDDIKYEYYNYMLKKMWHKFLISL
ncbi:sigma-G inhibitor, Gin [Crassaminicella thermophila]|uniref:Sigma-G inhibitor, Gin n=1 Tax=Crassaminicella thermophila TaxID=2599308 RepID=A0A5C0SFY5_CRATE|nr:sigma-G inhibitor, Gin [Crassaminicella thermophila]